MSDQKNPEKKLRFQDVYGLLGMVISLSVPAFLLLAVGILVTVNKEAFLNGADSDTYYLVTIGLLYGLSGLFLLSDLFLAVRRFHQLSGKEYEPILAEIVDISGGYLDVRFRSKNGNEYLGTAAAFFLMRAVSSLFYRGERVPILLVDGKLPVLLSAHGEKRWFAALTEKKTEQPVKASRVYGSSLSILRVSVYFDFVFFAGIVISLLTLLPSDNNQKMSILILGICLIAVSLAFILFSVFDVIHNLKKRLAKEGAVIKIRIEKSAENPTVLNAVLPDPENFGVIKEPLIGYFTKKNVRKLDVQKEYEAYVNSDGEVFLLK
jgi:hypothetical protein